jgi:hypothetical protein
MPAAPAAGGWTGPLVNGFHHLVAHLQEAHPLLLFLGLAGLFALTARSVRRWFAPSLLGFAFLAGWGPQLKPQLELGRMAIPLMFLAIAPAAIAGARLLRAADRRLAPARAALVALLVLGAWNVVSLYRNQGAAYYRVMPPAIRDFADRLRQEVPPDGRVMFAGATVHHFGHGHVAYLPVLAEREMMAVDYYHFPTTYVFYEYPPPAFLHSREAVLEFIRLYNVTHVVTFHDRWKSFFRDLDGQARELDGFEPVHASVFALQRESSRFLQGRGQVAAGFSALEVRLDDPAAEAVLCYNWHDHLSAPAPVVFLTIR